MGSGAAIAAVAAERVLDRAAQRQAPDPLRRPVGGDLGAAHAPDLLGVAFEEALEQPVAEAVDDPVAKRDFGAQRRHAALQVAPHAGGRIERRHLAQDVGQAQRVVDEPAVVEDAALAIDLDEVVGEHLAPPALDLARTGEEAVAADVDAVGAILDRARQAADVMRVAFQDKRAMAGAGQLDGRRQPRRSGANHDHRTVRILRHAESLAG
ncbi:MAG: hypothetical protein BWZ08_02367 [candidate division BRC1 bacterium ADurb.BinA292]|nr:MAG: hypothetical protein BWZ08_02367 [candidate division BRC1 bacterium ADurb.BinA292]